MSYRQAIKSVSVLWLSLIGSAVLAFLTQVILARQLGPVSFGEFSAALATITLLCPLAGFGVSGLWLIVFGKEGWLANRWLPASFRYIFISTFIVIRDRAAQRPPVTGDQAADHLHRGIVGSLTRFGHGTISGSPLPSSRRRQPQISP